MNIVVSSKSYYPMLGGSIVFASMLAKAFARAGHDVRIITRTPGTTSEEGDLPMFRQPTFSELREHAKWSDILFQIDASWRDALPFLMEGVPWFPTVHRGKVSYQGLPRKVALLLALESAGYHLGRAIGVSDFVARGWNLTSEPIANPFDDEFYYPPKSGAVRDIDLLYVGRVTRDKGVFTLLDAVRKLLNTTACPKPAKVAVVGSGVALDELIQASRGISKVEFFFPGMLSPREVGQWMRRSKVLAFPPNALEASPLTPLEAMACGCKIVASDIGGTKENTGPEGALVIPGNIDSLAHAMSVALKKLDDGISPEVAAFLESRKIETIAARYLERFREVLIPS